MRRQQLNAILHAMLKSHPSISDLVFATGRPLQVESDGELRPGPLQAGAGCLTAYQTEKIALNIVGDNPRLLRELLTRGACDCAYTTDDGVRFRANVYRQRGRYSVVMRRTQATRPHPLGARAGADLSRNLPRTERAHPRDRRHGQRQDHHALGHSG